LSNKLFDLTPKSKTKKNFSIILPPPNVTGQLHLGHAWDGALQDTIIRYKKLKGYRTV
jgi:valyl-tRNA synthetase